MTVNEFIKLFSQDNIYSVFVNGKEAPYFFIDKQFSTYTVTGICIESELITLRESDIPYESTNENQEVVFYVPKGSYQIKNVLHLNLRRS